MKLNSFLVYKVVGFLFEQPEIFKNISFVY